MYCPSCGAEIRPGAKFCAACGAPVPEAEAVEGATSPTDPEAPNETAAEVPAPTPEEATAPARAGAAPEDPGRPRGPLVAAVAAAVVAVAVAVGAWVWLSLLAPIPVDESTFPDAAVRSVVAGAADADGDMSISRDEAAAVTELSVDGAANLDGVGRFPNLRSIDVKGSSLSSADIGGLGELQSFSAPDSSLAELDVSRNPKLTRLQVPDATAVSGLEATALREEWLPVEIESSYKNTDTGEFVVSVRNEVERDAHGDPIKRTALHYSNGSVLSTATTVYDYNDAGRVSTATETYHYNGVGSDTVNVSTYSYDDTGKLTAVERKGSNNSTDTRVFAYDEANRLASVTGSYDSGSPTVATIEYDDQGRPTEVKTNDEGVLATWAYNEEGQLVESGNCYGDAVYLEMHELTFDDQGRVSQVKCTPGPAVIPDLANGSHNYLTTVGYTYDENGQIVSGESATSGTSEQSTKATCELDEAGRLVKMTYSFTSESSDGSTYTVESTKTQDFGRYFIPKDDDRDRTFISLRPTYDSALFSIYIEEPGVPLVPILEKSLTAFEYGADRDFYE